MYAGIILAISLTVVTRATLLGAAEVPDDLAEIFDNAEVKCLQVHKIPEDQRQSLLRVLDGVDTNIKCFLSCFFEEVGLMNGPELNGTLYETFLEEESKHGPTTDEEMDYLKSCVENVVGDDKCEKAFEYYKCLGHRFYKQPVDITQ